MSAAFLFKYGGWWPVVGGWYQLKCVFEPTTTPTTNH